MTVKTTHHTPGPWEIGSKDIADIGGFRVNRYAISGSGTAIASVWAGDPRKALKGIQHEGKANARLIHAAPDMAEALREVKRCMAVMQETDALPTDTCPADLFDMVSTALAKAGL